MLHDPALMLLSSSTPELLEIRPRQQKKPREKKHTLTTQKHTLLVRGLGRVLSYKLLTLI